MITACTEQTDNRKALPFQGDRCLLLLENCLSPLLLTVVTVSPGCEGCINVTHCIVDFHKKALPWSAAKHNSWQSLVPSEQSWLEGF